MDLTTVTGKVKEPLNKSLNALKAFPVSLGNLFARLSAILKPGMLKSGKGKINSYAERFTHSFSLSRIPAEKRRPLFFAFGGLVVLFLILIFTILAANSRGPKKSAPADISAGPTIPPGDLFIPGEPDFLPGLLLEREPRRSWTLEDIRPYWKNPVEASGPASSGESPARRESPPDFWRGEVKSAVDKIMEGVP